MNDFELMRQHEEAFCQFMKNDKTDRYLQLFHSEKGRDKLRERIWNAGAFISDLEPKYIYESPQNSPRVLHWIHPDTLVYLFSEIENYERTILPYIVVQSIVYGNEALISISPGELAEYHHTRGDYSFDLFTGDPNLVRLQNKQIKFIRDPLPKSIPQ